jgi:hypothetical protein
MSNRIVAAGVCALLMIFGVSGKLNLEIQNFCQSGCFVHKTLLKFGLIVTIP